MKSVHILLGLTIIITQCSPADNKVSIIGSWKVDSIYTYYNGFGFTRRDVAGEPHLNYQTDGKLKMSKNKESRFFLFELPSQDTVFHRSLNHELLEKFLIQDLNVNRLILRKDLRPVFKGINQQRYEIRYLSKI